MPPAKKGTRKRTTKPKPTNRPTVETTRVVQLVQLEHRTEAKLTERFALSTVNGESVKVERQTRYEYGSEMSEWDPCNETYTFSIDDLEAAIALVREG